MIKRTMDILVAAVALLMLWPLLLLLVLLVCRKLGTPGFFIQTRPGKHGKPFSLYKLRTMTTQRDKHGNLLPDAQRLTQFGRFLRSTSLDELPGLWNVLKGDMSLVGPRPLLMDYLPLYSKAQAVRHNVRPGLTGWAQVNGRNSLTWDEKFRLDSWYVNHQSVWLDMWILALTVFKVLRREGISGQGEATMTRFTGNTGGEAHDG